LRLREDHRAIGFELFKLSHSGRAVGWPETAPLAALCRVEGIVVGGREKPRTSAGGTRYDCFHAHLAPASRWQAGKVPALHRLARRNDFGQLDTLAGDFLFPAGEIPDLLS